AQAVDVGGADCGPLTVDRGGLGVHHVIGVAVDLDAGAQQPSVEAARQPVGYDVVRDARHQDPHPNATPTGRDQCFEDVMVGDEVGRSDVDAGLGAVDRLQIHAADRVQQLPW